jgi:hypothetical protein
MVRSVEPEREKERENPENAKNVGKPLNHIVHMPQS